MKTTLYPIRAVSKLTSISVDTLRAWERRHHAIAPQRDERGRLYTEADVRRLRLLNTAVEKGHAISRLASLSDEELQALITIPVTVANDAGGMKSAKGLDLTPRSVMAAIERMDYSEAEHELSLLASVLPPRELVHRVALPLMRQVGDCWSQGTLSVAQEHMASALLRNLLGALIPLYRRTSPASRLLFATPSGERHEFGILFSTMLAVGGGLGAIYLGVDLPAEEIVDVARKSAPQAVVLGFIGAEGSDAGIIQIQELAHKLPSHIELWVGGAQGEDLVEEIRKTRALLIEDFELLERHLVRLGARF